MASTCDSKLRQDHTNRRTVAMPRPFGKTAVAGLAVFLAAAAGLSGALASTKAKNASPTITKESFGTTPGGQAVDRYTMSNASGMVVKLITYGGTVQELRL